MANNHNGGDFTFDFIRPTEKHEEGEAHDEGDTVENESSTTDGGVGGMDDAATTLSLICLDGARLATRYSDAILVPLK
jgi:hypothetical protein